MLPRLKPLLFLLLLLSSCSTSPPHQTPQDGGTPEGGPPATTTSIRMHFERAGFYDAPFPSDDLIGADGLVNIAAFPNLPDPNTVAIVEQMKQLVAAGSHGFAETGAVYFSVDGDDVPQGLPDMAA